MPSGEVSHVTFEFITMTSRLGLAVFVQKGRSWYSANLHQTNKLCSLVVTRALHEARL